MALGKLLLTSGWQKILQLKNIRHLASPRAYWFLKTSVAKFPFPAPVSNTYSQPRAEISGVGIRGQKSGFTVAYLSNDDGFPWSLLGTRHYNIACQYSIYLSLLCAAACLSLLSSATIEGCRPVAMNINGPRSPISCRCHGE